MVVRPLRPDDFPALHAGFTDAFSDYVVPFRQSPDELRGFLGRRGWAPALSVGVFEGERLVAFTLNAANHGDRSRAYDTGTAVAPSHRRLGLAERTVVESIALLREAGYGEYLLEVITTNAAAVPLYEKLAFRTRRTFGVWSFRFEESPPSPHIEVRQLDSVDWDRLERWLDDPPSWQNSRASIERASDPKTILAAFENGVVSALAIVFPHNGDLPQLAVDPRARRQGLGRALLHRAAAAAGGTLRIRNVDRAAVAANGFLVRAGAKREIDQFEMSLSLL